MKTLFVPCFSKKKINLSKIKKSLLKQLPYQRIGLFATIQHLSEIAKLQTFLEENGKEIIPAGQLLGCDAQKVKRITGKVDAFLYLGSGKFHPLEIAIHSRKPVIILNPYSSSLQEISRQELTAYERKRRGALAKALEAKIFGILVSTKTGQFSPQARKIKKKIEASGKQALIFTGREISPERLLGFSVDVWVNTACPRIIDDYFDKAVITPEELDMIL